MAICMCGCGDGSKEERERERGRDGEKMKGGRGAGEIPFFLGLSWAVKKYGNGFFELPKRSQSEEKKKGLLFYAYEETRAKTSLETLLCLTIRYFITSPKKKK